MKKHLYTFLKNDIDFKLVYYKEYKKIKGYKALLKENIRFFVENYDIYLDKPYLDISYLKVNDKIVDIDLLYDIFKNNLSESY
jgi:hypothetical protein